MARRLTAAVVAAVLLLVAAPAAADVIVFEPGAPLNVRVRGASTLTTDEHEVRLPPGVHILGAAEWETLDAEIRRLQERETRLEAENESLRKSLRPGWGSVVGAVVGVVGGILLTWSTLRD